MELTSQELQSQTLSPQPLALAIDLVRVNGYVVFERVLPTNLTSALHAAFMRVFDAYVARTDPNRGANRFQMHLPFIAPFNEAAVITSPFAMPIIDTLLGKDEVCHYFASDTPLPGSDYQAVHSDITLLFPETPLSLPAYSIVVNLPLVDFTEKNGPLEIWPGGTHLMPGRFDLAALASLPLEELESGKA